MKKVFLQFLVSLATFLVVLFGFSRVDWLSVFHIRNTSVEEKLGEMYWDLFSKTETFVKSDSILAPIDSLITHICRENKIKRDKIKFHVLENTEVNAFAFPNNHLVIYTSLITECKNEMELCGVISHELAHMEKGHVMKKLIKEVGLSVLIGITSNGNGTEVLKETAKLLSSTAYDRTLESEADAMAVSYLMKAAVDPQPFADFLYRLAQEEELPSMTEWISTHPESKQRSETIIDLARGSEVEYKQVLDSGVWENLKKKVTLLTEESN